MINSSVEINGCLRAKKDYFHIPPTMYNHTGLV